MNTNNKSKLRILALAIMVLGLVTSQLFSAQPVVSNVTAAQRADSKLVDISYDLADADGDEVTISVRISHNEGGTYDVSVLSMTGDVGPKLSVGQGKQIVWDAGADWDGEFSDKMKVKIIAQDKDDWKKFPGLEFGTEVKPGAFLFGDQGHPEAKSVNIKHSYWASKYEITVGQYCHFLNMATAEGWVRKNNNVVWTTANNPWGAAENVKLIHLRGAAEQDIRYLAPLNRYEPWDNPDIAIGTYWPGAYLFAKAYGYDLPTEAEWEKAARGPKFDDLGEQRNTPFGSNVYKDNPWRQIIFDRSQWVKKSVKYHTPIPNVNSNLINTINGYGLYNMLGTEGEWTRTSLSGRNYPSIEDLENDIHGVNYPFLNGDKIVRDAFDNVPSADERNGWSDLRWNYWIKQQFNSRRMVDGLRTYDRGFRIVRRKLP